MIVDARLCPCGSGLRLVRCCQMDFSMGPPPAVGQPLLPTVQRAVEAHGQGAVEEAELLCLEVLELAPAQPDALALLYRIRKAAGQENAAQILLRRMVQLHPNTVWATQELTLALFGRGAIAEAELHARNAVRIAPENPQSHNLLGGRAGAYSQALATLDAMMAAPTNRAAQDAARRRHGVRRRQAAGPRSDRARLHGGARRPAQGFSTDTL